MHTLIDKAFLEATNELSRIYNPHPPPHGILYHYTDFAGLQGILKSHTLWATYNRVLNDASEQYYAERIIQDELTRLTSPESKTISFADQKHFVTCFCQNVKLLSMWRTYADKGAGYCLGFDYAGLNHHMCWPEPKPESAILCLYPYIMATRLNRFAITLSTFVGVA